MGFDQTPGRQILSPRRLLWKPALLSIRYVCNPDVWQGRKAIVHSVGCECLLGETRANSWT